MIFTLIWYVLRSFGVFKSFWGALGLDFLNLFFICLLVACFVAAKRMAEEKI